MSLSLIPDRGLAVGTQSTGIRTARRRVLACAAFLIVSVLGGCTAPPETSLQRLVEARQRTADLMLHFTTAADAGNRAVLADTDESSAAFAREAAQATEAAEKDAAALAPMFEALDYAEESRLLKEFNTRFAEFRTLDRNVLELAVANTNTKAQQLAFGPAQSSVDELDRALEAVAVASGEPNWRVQALVARTLAAVRAIQLLQAPHIAEATDAAMTRMEAQMAASEKTARASLQMLSSVTPPVGHSATRRRHCRIGPIHGPQRSDRRPVPAEHERSIAVDDAGSETDAHDRLSGHAASAREHVSRARLHRNPVATSVRAESAGVYRRYVRPDIALRRR
jgi:hypothetical protein